MRLCSTCTLRDACDEYHAQRSLSLKGAPSISTRTRLEGWESKLNRRACYKRLQTLVECCAWRARLPRAAVAYVSYGGRGHGLSKRWRLSERWAVGGGWSGGGHGLSDGSSAAAAEGGGIERFLMLACAAGPPRTQMRAAVTGAAFTLSICASTRAPAPRNAACPFCRRARSQAPTGRQGSGP
jgi:hypothetical protein